MRGDWTATINDGELIIDIQGVISADTEVAKFKVLSGTSQVDAGSLQGVVKPDTSAISQGEGPTTGGNSVTLTGQDYQNATSVSFGATSAPFTVTSDTQITTTAPVGGGTVSVTVTSAQGTGQGVPYSYLSDYSSTVLSDNPIVYWPLGDPAGSTTANDVSGGGRQGTYTSCATRGAPGPIAHDASTAATFSADGCYMQFTPGGGDSYWGSFSAEAWFKATGSITQEFRTLISSRTSNGEYSFDFGVTGTTFGDGQTLHADIGDGNEWLNTGDVPFAFKIGQWYDVAISVDATNNVATYYVNGSSIGSVGLSSDDTSPLLYDSGHPIAVGENTRYLGLHRRGVVWCSIAQVALYPAALSSNDLLTHYEVGTGQSLLTASLSSNTSSVSAISNIDEQSLPSADVESGAPADSAGNTASAPLRSIPLSSSQLGFGPAPFDPLALHLPPGPVAPAAGGRKRPVDHIAVESAPGLSSRMHGNRLHRLGRLVDRDQPGHQSAAVHIAGPGPG